MSAATGEPHSRVDGPAKVTGAARYAAEFSLPDLAYGAIVQSTIAKGRITAIDGGGRARARRARGDHARRTRPSCPTSGSIPRRHGRPGDRPADPDPAGRPRAPQRQYVGLVVAETLEQATWPPIWCASPMTRSRRRRRSRPACPCLPLVEANEGGGTTASYRRGDLCARLPTLPRRSTGPTSLPARTTIRSRPTPRSPHGTANDCCCTTRPSGRATSAAASRSPSASRARPGDLAVRRRRLRQRARTWPHVILAAMAQEVGRPVKIVLTRRRCTTASVTALHHPARGARRRARRPPGCDHPRRHRRDLLLRGHRAAARCDPDALPLRQPLDAVSAGPAEHQHADADARPATSAGSTPWNARWTSSRSSSASTRSSCDCATTPTPIRPKICRGRASR